MEQYAKELMRRVTKPSHYSQVITRGENDIWALDLAQMDEWKESNNGYKFILVCVDCLTRYVRCASLKSKNAKEVWDAFTSLTHDVKPHKIWCDQGGEFYNGIWTKGLKDMGIERYSTYGEHKASIAERFIRTLKHKIWYLFLKDNNREWVDRLQEVVEEYNYTKHSTLGMSPKEAQGKEGELMKELYKPLRTGKPKYQIGDIVRISRVKQLFERGFHPNWSYEMYRINSIFPYKPVKYYLETLEGEAVQGAFYTEELQPVAKSIQDFFPIEKVLKSRTVKGVKQILVKFQGYNDERWINAESAEKI